MAPMLIGILLLFAPALVHASPLVDSDVELGFPSAVALGTDLGDAILTVCTGTLITPRLVLTAAHCSDDLTLEEDLSHGAVFFGPRAGDPDRVLALEGVALHPGYLTLSPLEPPRNDVALLLLAAEASVEPTGLRREALGDEHLGLPLKSVGYGVTDSGSGGGAGTRRSADLALDGLDGDFIISFANADGALVCDGDSGGPQFHEEDGRWVQWGVHAWADQDCSSYAGSTRVDLVIDWILDEVESLHGSTDFCAINGWYGDGACDAECLAYDPDCNREAVDETPSLSCATGRRLPVRGWFVPLALVAALAGRRRWAGRVAGRHHLGGLRHRVRAHPSG